MVAGADDGSLARTPRSLEGSDHEAPAPGMCLVLVATIGGTPAVAESNDVVIGDIDDLSGPYADNQGSAAGNLLTSLTFGGPDLSTVFLGGLRSTDIPFFKSPVPGLPMIHW